MKCLLICVNNLSKASGTITLAITVAAELEHSRQLDTTNGCMVAGFGLIWASHLVLLALSNDNNTIHCYTVEHLAHHVHGSLRATVHISEVTVMCRTRLMRCRNAGRTYLICRILVALAKPTSR